MYLTHGQVGDLRCARGPRLPVPFPSLSQYLKWNRKRVVGGPFQAQLHTYRAGLVLCFPDLTVALANPIKYFNAHDKKSMKLKEVTGSLPEVGVTWTTAKNLQGLWNEWGGAEFPARGKGC